MPIAPPHATWSDLAEDVAWLMLGGFLILAGAGGVLAILAALVHAACLALGVPIGVGEAFQWALVVVVGLVTLWAGITTAIWALVKVRS